MTHFHDHHGHGHGHGHGADLGDWEEPVGVGIRQALTVAVIVLAVGTLAGLALWWPRGEPRLDRNAVAFGNRVDATVTAAETGPCTFDPAEECHAVDFQVTSGPNDGDTGSIEVSAETDTPATGLGEGDDFVVTDAGPGAGEGRFQFADVQRRSPLLILAALFAIAVVALGRRRGLLALAGIVVTIGVLLVFVFPALLRGTSPVGVALTGAGVIAFATFYLAHGINRRTSVALVGTYASLLLTAALASVFAGLASLSGLGSDESLNLLAFAPELDFRGLLLAAVVIGALGVLDDVTITQVSAVWELRRSNSDMGPRQLYAAGIRIGRDHIASTVNTLVLAYTAAALPLLLLFTQSGLGLGEVLTTEAVAVEVVQTLVGSIGLIASVPLTTALACWIVTRSDADDQPDDPPEPRGSRSRSRSRRDPGPDEQAEPGPGPQPTRPHEAVVPAWQAPPADPWATRPGGRTDAWPHDPAPTPGPAQDPHPSGTWPAHSPGTSDAWASEERQPSGTWPGPGQGAGAPGRWADQDPEASAHWASRDPRTSGRWPAQGTGTPEPWAEQDPAPPDAWPPRPPARPRTTPRPPYRRPQRRPDSPPDDERW